MSQGTSESLQPPGLEPFLKKMLKSRSCSSAGLQAADLRHLLKVTESSRTPQIILTPLEPGLAGPWSSGWHRDVPRGIPSPAFAPSVPSTAGARCPVRIYLRLRAFHTFPSPRLWGSWGCEPAGFGAVPAGFGAVPAGFGAVSAGFRAVPAAFWVLSGVRRCRMRSRSA